MRISLCGRTGKASRYFSRPEAARQRTPGASRILGMNAVLR